MFLASSVITLAIISVASAVPESTCSAASGSPGATSASSAAPAAASVVPFEARQDSQIVVPLYLDGTGPWRFLVDTGASRSAVSHAVALQVGMPVVSQAGTPAVVRLTNLTVGCARAQALLAPTLSRGEVRQLGTDVVGVLGQDFLARFSYTLDYRANRLVWESGADDGRDEPAPPDRRRVRLPLQETDAGFVVDVAGTRFVPASAVPATQGVILFAGARTNQLLANSAALPGELLPFDRGRAARLVILKRLQIGTAALWEVPAVVMLGPNGTQGVPNGDELPNGDEAQNGDEDGLLPLSLFARVTFHPRQGYVEFETR